jgi:LysR family transcriptional regulator, glycine cleavage system transcriptional activator
VRNISHLKGIQAFEASARRLSFADAARELNVTPAAIAQLVRSLETWLGTPLFVRTRTGPVRLLLTESGRSALGPVSRGLDQIDEAVHQVRMASRRKGITVTASSALATRWLIPHLDRFSTLHPDIEIRLDVTDRTVDFERREADIGIRCGPGSWNGAEAFKLMDETVVAVCSPTIQGIGVFDAGKDPSTPRWNDANWIIHQTPIHDTSIAQGGVFPDWALWFQSAGLDCHFGSAGLSINSTAAVIQSVLNGQGVALVRDALVAHDVAAGRLVRCLAGHGIPFAWSYYCLVAQSSRHNPHVGLFADWLRTHWASEYATKPVKLSGSD